MSEIIDYAFDVLDKLAQGWLFKAVTTLAALLFAGIYVPISALMGLVVVDTLLGTWLAWRGKQLNYRVWRNKTVTKFFVYFALIIAARLVELLLGGSGEVLGVKPANLTLMFLGVTEFASIIRNGSTLVGRPLNPFGLKKAIDDLRSGTTKDS